jgi:hypothetical protein
MDFNCNICKKTYASYKSLWNHNKKFHKPDIILISSTKHEISSTISSKISSKKPEISSCELLKEIDNSKLYKCRHCDNTYVFIQGRWKHEKICKEINKEVNEKEINEKEVNEKIKKMEKENEEIKQDMELLKSELKKGVKIKNQTNNVNNGTIININGLGYENILPKLTKDEKIDILTSLLFKEIPAVELIRKIYNNDKFIEDRNTIINNLQSKTCLVYNQESEKFDAKNKNTHIEDMIDWRNKDIKKMMNEMKDSPKIKKYTRKLIEDYIDNTDEIKKTLAYKKYKEEIIYIIYNCKEFMKKLYTTIN